jgi:hypothetical protein
LHLISIYCWIVRNGLESKLDVIEKLLKPPCIVEHIFVAHVSGAEALQTDIFPQPQNRRGPRELPGFAHHDATLEQDGFRVQGSGLLFGFA